MKPITISITTFGIEYDHGFVASSISASLQEQLDEVEVALDAAVTADDYPTVMKLGPRQLIATQAELDFKRLTELVNEPSTKPVLVVRLPRSVWKWPGGVQHNYYILDGHHRVASARLRGVDVEAVVVG
jgi:hypothetical protein